MAETATRKERTAENGTGKAKAGEEGAGGRRTE